MIKDIKFKIPVDSRGSITSGIKATNSEGKEYPKAVDYFVVNDFKELLNSYGDKPTKLLLFLPSNEIEECLDVNYVLYGSNQQKIRQCDGENCYHRIANEIEGIAKFTAGSTTPCICKQYELAEDHKKKCRTFFWMKAFIADYKLAKVENPHCYLFKSGSKNSAENILSELVKIKKLTGGLLFGIPFLLSVNMVPSSKDSKRKFPIWSLESMGTLTQLKEWNENLQLRIPTKRELQLLHEPVPPIDEDNIESEFKFDKDNPLNV